MGTAAFAVPSLRALAASRHEVVAVYTQPARPAGRGWRPRPSAVQSAAEKLAIPVRAPASLRDPAAQKLFAALQADLAVVAAYGLILPRAILDAPRLGCINLHASLLPRWRGAAPIQRALLAGDHETGITIFLMEPGLDTGPVIASRSLAIADDSTAASLHDALAEFAAGMVVAAVDDLAAGRARPRPQPEAGVTYAAKIEKSEGRLDWTRPAALLERQLRALNPRPGCWTEIGDGTIRVLAGRVVPGAHGGAPGEVLDERLTVACGEGCLELTLVQRAGGRPLPADAFLRGFPVPVGTRLGRPCPATS
ncbi:MAG TPA: methionyl-tRNA formyltransferase [Geminicoccaceae bacterium]|nr:methionyl-tRNA formyltransferase [Geminicoccaceae bacterium]